MHLLWPRTETLEAVAAPPASELFGVLAAGDEAIRAGEWQTAESNYAQAASLDRASADAEIGWARSLTFQYKAPDAAGHARRAVELSPRKATAYSTLALALDWAGDVDGATAAARRSIDLDPNLAEAYAFLAETQADRYQLADGWRSLDRAIALDPEGVEPQRVRGYLYETGGQYIEAADAYERAIGVAPSYSHLYFSLGNVLRALGRNDAATQRFRMAMTLAPADARPRVGMALLYLTQGDVPAALPYLEEATQLDPAYGTAQGQLGTARYFLGDYERAREPLEAAIRLEHNRDRLSTYQHVLGWVYLKSDQLDAAQAQFQAALAVNPQLDGARDGLEAVKIARSRS